MPVPSTNVLGPFATEEPTNSRSGPPNACPTPNSPQRPAAPIPIPRENPGRGRWTYAFRPRLPSHDATTQPRCRSGIQAAIALSCAPVGMLRKAETPTETCVASPHHSLQPEDIWTCLMGLWDGEARFLGMQMGGLRGRGHEIVKCDEPAAANRGISSLAPSPLLSSRAMPYRLLEMTTTSRCIIQGAVSRREESPITRPNLKMQTHNALILSPLQRVPGLYERTKAETHNALYCSGTYHSNHPFYPPTRSPDPSTLSPDSTFHHFEES